MRLVTLPHLKKKKKKKKKKSTSYKTATPSDMV